MLTEHDRTHRQVAVVGRDPRASGEMLEAAVVAGLTSAGCDVLRVGVLPTPAIAYLVDALGADLGVVLSASHNPMPDNGVKLFARGGHKLPDAVEDEIEARRRRAVRPADRRRHRPRHRRATPLDRYVDHLIDDQRRVPGRAAHRRRLRQRRLLDRRPRGLPARGRRGHRHPRHPDGLNINDGCGSTHLESLRAAVVDNGADLGIAHDGDADRCLAVDATGEVVDGDQIMAVLALAMKEHGALTDDTLVATVMSNLGLHLAMREHGVTDAHHRGRRPLRASRSCGPAATPSAANSPATSSCPRPPPPATAC